MIQTVQVENFKSIRKLELNCGRVNVLIGKPNVGKSNILEAIGLFSLAQGDHLRDYLRMSTVVDLYYNQDLEKKIVVRCDRHAVELSFQNGEMLFDSAHRIDKQNEKRTRHASFRYKGDETIAFQWETAVRFYRFQTLVDFPRKEAAYLLPPAGSNLFTIVHVNKKLRQWFNELLSDFGFRLNIRQVEEKMEIVKEVDGVLVSLPLFALAETLQRLLFYKVAMDSNSNATLLFEEPEAHLFPHYAKFLAESIAMEERGNQYFISTHNPYFLNALVQKTPVSQLRVMGVGYLNGETVVFPFREDQLPMVLDPDADIFFNLDLIVGQ